MNNQYNHNSIAALICEQYLNEVDQALLADPAISDWLKQQIINTKQRDVLDGCSFELM